MGSIDIQQFNAHGDHEPVRSGDGLVAPNSFKYILRRGTSRPPSKVRFMESVDIQRCHAHGGQNQKRSTLSREDMTRRAK